MKGVKNLKLKNYLNTICSKNHNIHEFDNVLHALGIKDVLCLCVFEDCLGKLDTIVLLSS
jgi:hypothetical protein